MDVGYLRDDWHARFLWIGLPVVAAALAVANLALGGKVVGSGFRPLDLLGYGLAGTAVAGLALCRHRPRLALLVVGAASVTYTMLDYPWHPGQFAIAIVLFLAFVCGARREATLMGLVAAVCVVVVAPQLVEPEAMQSMGRMLTFFIPTVPIVAGYAVWTQQQRIGHLKQTLALTEQARATEIQRDSANQRIALARDLHDTVGHGISVIAVQSGAALSVLDSDPEAARAALLTINESCRTAMAETKQALSALRGTTSATRPPSLEATVLTAETTGLDVTLHQSGSFDNVDVSLADTVRRLAQESLTNTLKHAAAGRVEVVVDISDASLTFEYLDIARHAKAKHQVHGSGSGLQGMAARVADVGGQFDAGPTPHGFRVAAKLPLAPSML